MKLTNDAKNLVNQCNNLGELRLFIREYLKIRYEWINKIDNIELLQSIICKNLIDLINISLIEKIKDKTQLDKLSEEMIEQLFTKKVYSNEEKNYLIKLKSIKKHKPVVNKKSMWKPKKKKGVQKKAVSL
jgi:hypothetical protein